LTSATFAVNLCIIAAVFGYKVYIVSRQQKSLVVKILWINSLRLLK